jgi:hypothetical protein
MNHAIAASQDHPPQVVPGGLSLAFGMANAAFRIPNSSTIDMGTDDFIILVVAGLVAGSQDPTQIDDGRCFFNKADGKASSPKGITLDWENYAGTDYRVLGQVNETITMANVMTNIGQVRLYGLRRAADRLEVRINGQIVNSATSLDTPGASTQNTRDAYVGQYGPGDPTSVNTLHAAVVVKGTVSAPDLGTLESYLLRAFGI